MKGIPAHLIVRNDNIPDLDQMYWQGQADDDIALLRIEFTKFLKASFSTFVGPKSLTKEEIDNSYFRRLIVDKIFTQASRSRRVEDDFVDIPEFGALVQSFLFELLIKNTSVQTDRLSVPKLNLDKLPADWKKLSNTRKQSYVVGGPNPDFSSWKGLSLDRLPVSSFIIVDPYFLERWNETELNLKSILNGLIDPKLGVKKFELIIALRNDPKNEVPKAEIIKNQEKLVTLLKNEFPKYLFSITLVYVNKKYTHDRYLFTDFFYLKSGGGFNFYRSKGMFDKLKSNDLSVHMLSDIGEYIDYKKRLQIVFDWMNSTDSLYGAEGKLESRLLGFIE
ncbi:MAG: hypothetical protein PSV36_19105 [Algoriphagus sp.]|nr:hypothetical protein [Algoriphagus sp.]